MSNSTLPAIQISVNKNTILPDNAQWKNRFEVRSASSNRIYIISQNIAKGHMGCSCPGWRTRRNCKHLIALGLPGYEEPVVLNIKEK
jgi:hypothetical protein